VAVVEGDRVSKRADAYGAYVIEPTPHHLNGVGPWTQWLQIARTDPGGATRVQLFNGPATFPTRAEAVAACIELGRDIIDGKMPDRAVLF
jgi:hypothetical protein